MAEETEERSALIISFDHTHKGSSHIVIEEWWDADEISFKEIRGMWCKKFDPHGYGTIVKQLGEPVQVGHKKVLATQMNRASSCD